MPTLLLLVKIKYMYIRVYPEKTLGKIAHTKFITKLNPRRWQILQDKSEIRMSPRTLTLYRTSFGPPKTDVCPLGGVVNTSDEVVLSDAT